MRNRDSQTCKGFTLQNKITGKYISSLFSDSIYETFQAKNINDAYIWNDASACDRLAAEWNMKVGHVIADMEYKERNIVINVVEIH